MNILISGATGFLGSALSSSLEQSGYEVNHLVRRAAQQRPGDILWNPTTGELPVDRLEGFDAVIHLAGESIAQQRWTSAMKDRIRRSRVEGTKSLVEGLVRCEHQPRVLISASAIGFYGNRGREILEEAAPAGKGFLASVCQDWEAATLPARKAGIRVVNARFAMILHPHGGALQRMLPIFRYGLGGQLGNGRQYMSWISRDDAVRALHHCLSDESFDGPVNICSPHPVMNRDFTKTLGQVLHRPTVFGVPAIMLKLLLGQMGEELMLSSARCVPARLQKTQFVFLHEQLESALQPIEQLPEPTME